MNVWPSEKNLFISGVGEEGYIIYFRTNGKSTGAILDWMVLEYARYEHIIIEGKNTT